MKIDKYIGKPVSVYAHPRSPPNQDINNPNGRGGLSVAENFIKYSGVLEEISPLCTQDPALFVHITNVDATGFTNQKTSAAIRFSDVFSITLEEKLNK